MGLLDTRGRSTDRLVLRGRKYRIQEEETGCRDHLPLGNKLFHGELVVALGWTTHLKGGEIVWINIPPVNTLPKVFFLELLIFYCSTSNIIAASNQADTNRLPRGPQGFGACRSSQLQCMAEALTDQPLRLALYRCGKSPCEQMVAPVACIPWGSSSSDGNTWEMQGKKKQNTPKFG